MQNKSMLLWSTLALSLNAPISAFTMGKSGVSLSQLYSSAAEPNEPSTQQSMEKGSETPVAKAPVESKPVLEAAEPAPRKGSFLPRAEYYGEMAAYDGRTLEGEFIEREQVVSETSDKHFVIHPAPRPRVLYKARDQYYGEMAMGSGSTLDLEFTTNRKVVSETSDKNYIIPRDDSFQGEYQRPQAREQYYGEMAMQSGSTLDLEFTTNPKVASETSDKNYIIPREATPVPESPLPEPKMKAEPALPESIPELTIPEPTIPETASEPAKASTGE
mmetsp:Transcript_19157/g.44679  ORF Transcript_19157/g.44679 Transcript_19157/m.44679 type:complete len:274 (-) Transcript_19157:178-999(-)